MAGPSTLIPDLMQVQIGKESTWGTSVAGSAKLQLVEECTITPELEGTTLPDVRGSLAPGYVQSLDKSSGSAKVSGVATYEDLPYWLNSLLGEVSPSGAGPYVYAPVAPLTSAPNRRIMTLIKGMTGGIYKLAGGIVTELTLSCEAGGQMKYEASLIGKNVASGTLAGLSDRTVNPILASHFGIYLDAWGGTMGASAIAGVTWFSFELSIKSNAANTFGLGSINPAMYRDAKYEGTLKLALEYNSTTAGYLTSIAGSSLWQKQIRLKATDSTRICQLDFAGGSLKAPEISTDTDGVATLEFELSGLYNSNLANWFKSSITNGVNALP
jgi:hypothetical protein